MRFANIQRYTAALLVTTVAVARAQTSATTFTAEDALNINAYAVADLTDDGRYLAVTNTLRRDSYGQDFRRDGDPTYTRGIPVRVLIIDTKTGTSTPVFPDKRPVKALQWSPDGTRLGMLLYNGDVFEPMIWDRATNKVTVSHLPAGKYVAENSDLRWTPDGKQLVFAVHTLEWRKKARDTFNNMTTGPVFVQSSMEPFLAWDDVRRLANRRSVVAFDPATNQMRELVPETMVNAYTLAEDGSAISYNADIQKKTDYDSFGSETSLRMRSTPAGMPGAERTLYTSTKGMQIQWSDDGRHYAYSKDGRVYVASIADSSAKQIAGPAEARPGQRPDTSKAARDSLARQRFSVVRYSPANDAVVVSNREGLWLVDLPSGAKTQIVATDDSSTTAPRYALTAWSNDGKHLYLSSQSRAKWERGLLRFDRGANKVTELVKDGRSYSGLRLSKDGNTAIVSIASGNRPADIYVADASLGGMRRLIESNPQLTAKRIGTTELVNYLDADGHPKNAVVYNPAVYQ